MIDRTTIVVGPGAVTFDSIVYYSKTEITLTPKMSTFELMSAMHGKFDIRLKDVVFDVTFTPVGKWAGLSTLFPDGTPAIGSSLLGATDKNVVINTLAGQQITCKAAFVSKISECYLSATKTLFGSVTLTCIGANNTAWTDAAKRAAIATQAFADTSFAPADVITQAYTVAWGASSPYSSMSTLDGVTISFARQTTPIETDADGIVDYRLAGADVSAKFTPVGLSETQLLTLLKCQGTGVVRGASLGTVNGAVLNVSGTGVYFRIYNAVPTETPMVFDNAKNRAGAVTMIGTRTYSAGALQPLYYAGAAAPA